MVSNVNMAQSQLLAVELIQCSSQARQAVRSCHACILQSSQTFKGCVRAWTTLTPVAEQACQGQHGSGHHHLYLQVRWICAP